MIPDQSSEKSHMAHRLSAVMTANILSAAVCSFFLILVSMPLAAPAKADLRVCNKSTSQVGISIGYRSETDWQTEGWWNLPSNACETLIPGPLNSRFYYLYMIDYDLGNEFSGPAIMCTDEKEFTILGIRDCIARGYERSGFQEIDTGDHQTWLVEIPPLERQESTSQ